VSPALQFSHEREIREVFVAHLSHLENVVGANLNAIALSLAGIAVHYRPIGAGFRRALLSWPVRV
jgi:hypothetical protein